MDLVKTGGASTFLAEDIVVDAPDSLTSGEVGTVTVTINEHRQPPRGISMPRASGRRTPTIAIQRFFVDGDWLATNRATAVDAQTAAGRARHVHVPDQGARRHRPRPSIDEAFSFVQEGVTWFGPTFHVVVQVKPGPRQVAHQQPAATSVGSGSGWPRVCAVRSV